jgi:hypothetical protein
LLAIVRYNPAQMLGQVLGQDMARRINRLNARAVATLTKHGRHADGGGLYLSISPNGGRRWVFLFRWHSKPTEIGLGSARDVTLARARELASQARAKLAEGVNPKDARRPAQGATFGECAGRLIEAMRPSWRNLKHAAQWEMTLRVYAAPLRPLPVHRINTEDVLSVLKPRWKEKPETATRLRGRIERVLDAAKAQGLRAGDNPARWRGHLDQLLAKRQRLTRGHHAAIPYVELPRFISDLRTRQAAVALALEFAILTAARSGEVLGARWDEFDLDRAVWTIPAVRMKAGREHRVPLSKGASKSSIQWTRFGTVISCFMAKSRESRCHRLEQVRTDARKLLETLSALEDEDLDGLVWRGKDVSKSEYKRQLERLAEVSEYIADLGTIAPEVLWPLKGPRPPTITAYLVLQDAAAIFEWLTGTKATREADRDSHSEQISPFFRFASILWPVLFGKGTSGLPSAIQNWAAWRKKFDEHSALITNITLRHPTWGISGRE